MTTLLLIVIYFIFVSLGLPDAMLGSAWPIMYPQFNVPVSYAGIISMLIALGTVVSALQSDRLTKKFGPGIVTACSVGLTAALFPVYLLLILVLMVVLHERMLKII